MIGQVKFCTIPVTDQQRALDWYTEKLGFTVKTDQTFGPPDHPMRWLELWVAPNRETHVVLWSDPKKVGGFQPIAFSADDVQKTYEELSARGVEFTQPPKQESWGWSSMFKDPDGNVFLIGSNT
jgi:catechol 2,3-dioxygenase-like lactoylglutathione lyase family enzyme